tara:strand:- start:420 stop:1280 length:861 start_codon:yes stop_codon:yes gene_type:complete
MPNPIAAIGAAVSIGGSLLKGRGASQAAKAQIKGEDAAIAEQRAAREELRKLLNPYVSAGTPAIQAQMNLIGLGTGSTNWDAYAQSNPAIMQAYEAQKTGFGFDFGGFGPYAGMSGQFGGTQSLADFAKNYYETTGRTAGEDISAFTTTPEQVQQQAISGIAGGAGFQALARQGEEGILQNASATGGLRGGNVQGALAQFRPALLNQFIEQQYERLGGMANLGQASAAGVGAAGMETATKIGEGFQNIGAARAGNKLAQAKMLGSILGGVGNIAKGFAGGSAQGSS